MRGGIPYMNQQKKKAGSMAVLNRVIRYMLHHYKYLFILVVVCILISAIATVIGATFPQTLVDDYIEPMLTTGINDFDGLFQQIVRLICIMAIGILAAYAYTRIMVNVSQGTMRNLRDDLFHSMESLPIKYFDTHAHGDITNDVDTLRQLLSQSVPQIINTAITMVATFVTMVILNPALTVISIITAIIMFTFTGKFSQLSGKYYARQQRDLGIVLSKK